MSKILCVLDGFGLSPKTLNNASALAKMPNFKYLLKNYFWSTLNADGVNVGQEAGLVGNSEVGHMNIGGLKLVPQLSYQITKSAEKAFDLNKEIAPDQFFDPKKFLERNWQKISFFELKQHQDENSIKLCETYDLCVNTGVLDGGEKLNSDSTKVYVGDLIEFLETWWIYDIMSLTAIQEMIAVFEKNQKELRIENDKTKTQILIFNTLKNIYESLGITTSIELINYFNQKKSKTLHLTGLFSTGQIHSDLRHWAGAIEAAGTAGAEKIVLHIISDGRDSDRQSLVATWEYFIKEFDSKIKPFEDKIFLGSLSGRFYAMDRDNNWERVHAGLIKMLNFWDLYQHEFDNQLSSSEVAYQEFLKSKFSFDFNCFQEPVPATEPDPSYQIVKLSDSHFEAIQKNLTENTNFAYKTNIFDETIYPKSMIYQKDERDEKGYFEIQGISKNDTLWLINFRTDRMKQFSQVLTDINEEFNLNLTILSNNSYGIKKEEFLNENLGTSEPHLPGHFTEDTYQKGCYYPIFKNQPVEGTLAEFISKSGKNQLHIAETEKYNHVTYFMNGGQNKKWENEAWEVVESNKVNSHAEKPEMKAKEVTDFILEKALGKYDYILVNYANPDMVGHTGDIKAAITTMEFLDQQLGRLIQACEQDGHEMIITADHGNIEKVGEYFEVDKTLIDTEHNANFVPLVILSPNTKIENQKNTDDFKDIILKNAKNLIVSKVSNPNLDDLKLVLDQENQVDLAVDTWLEDQDIPNPILPLWYSGLLLVCL